MLLQLTIGATILLQANMRDLPNLDYFLLNQGECLELSENSRQYSAKACCNNGDLLEGAKGINSYERFFQKPLADRWPVGGVLLRCVKADDPKTASDDGPVGSFIVDDVALLMECKGFPLYHRNALLQCVVAEKGKIVPKIETYYFEKLQGRKTVYEITYLDSQSATLTRAWWFNGEIAIEWILNRGKDRVDQGKFYDLGGNEMEEIKWNLLFKDTLFK